MADTDLRLQFRSRNVERANSSMTVSTKPGGLKGIRVYPEAKEKLAELRAGGEQSLEALCTRNTDDHRNENARNVMRTLNPEDLR